MLYPGTRDKLVFGFRPPEKNNAAHATAVGGERVSVTVMNIYVLLQDNNLCLNFFTLDKFHLIINGLIELKLGKQLTKH